MCPLCVSNYQSFFCLLILPNINYSSLFYCCEIYIIHLYLSCYKMSSNKSHVRNYFKYHHFWFAFFYLTFTFKTSRHAPKWCLFNFHLAKSMHRVILINKIKKSHLAWRNTRAHIRLCTDRRSIGRNKS